MASRLTTLLPRLALAAFAAGFAGSALAATNANIDCGRDSSFINDAETTELSVNVVDLSQVKGEADFERPRDVATNADDTSLAPLLYLAPRVESILDDVFDENAVEELEAAASNDVESESSIAPVAESAQPSAEEPKADGQELDVAPAILRVQREMYRTDI